MTAQTCWKLYNSREKWFGAVRHETREAAEQTLREFMALGPSWSQYDTVIEIEQPGAPKWLVTETAYGRTIGRREFPTEAEANTEADKWRGQSAGKVEVRQVEVTS